VKWTFMTRGYDPTRPREESIGSGASLTATCRSTSPRKPLNRAVVIPGTERAKYNLGNDNQQEFPSVTLQLLGLHGERDIRMTERPPWMTSHTPLPGRGAHLGSASCTT